MDRSPYILIQKRRIGDELDSKTPSPALTAHNLRLTL